MPHIFISYSRRDGDFAEVLRRRLVDAGFDCWIDQSGLRAGEEWAQEIDQALRDAAAVVVVISPASANSAYVAYEWAFALGSASRVIPLVLAEAPVHPRLASLQHLDFTRPEERPWDTLLRALEEAVQARPTESIRVPRTAPAVVRESVASLDDPNPEVMEKAMTRLAELRLPAAEAALVAALEHPLPDVRIAAAWRLAARGDPRALPGLIEGDRRRGWAWEFARQVARIGPAALPGLRSAVTDPSPTIRRDIAWAFGSVGDPSSVPDLVRLLDDPDLTVRIEAAGVLKRMERPEATAAFEASMDRFLKELREAPPETGRKVARFLADHGTEPARRAAERWLAEDSGRSSPTAAPAPGR